MEIRSTASENFSRCTFTQSKVSVESFVDFVLDFVADVFSFVAFVLLDVDLELLDEPLLEEPLYVVCPLAIFAWLTEIPPLTIAVPFALAVPLPFTKPRSNNASDCKWLKTILPAGILTNSAPLSPTVCQVPEPGSTTISLPSSPTRVVPPVLVPQLPLA